MMVEEIRPISSRAAKLKKGDSRAASGHLSTLWKDPASRRKPRKQTELRRGHRALTPFQMPNLTMPKARTPAS